MDMQLPGRTGYDAVRELKADAATAAIPVVAVTAQAMAGDREKALEAGCDEYCTKPLETTRFRALLQRFLNVRGA
jgi:CheY-like chemotaxis protein